MADVENPGWNPYWRLRPANGREIYSHLVLDRIGIDWGPPAPATLFHYTSAVGLQSILETKQLFLTHSAYLNDQGELGYPARLASKIITEMKAADGEEAHKDFWKYLGVCCDAHSESVKWYVGSFSVLGNQLGQWRAYTAHGGYSMGFRGDTLKGTMPGLGPVIYRENEQVTGFRRLVEILLDTWKTWLVGATPEETDQFNRVFFPIAAELLARKFIFWKSPAFAEEAEWRVALPFLLPEVRFQVRGDLLTPYHAQNVPVANGLLPLNEIFVSPLGDPSLAKKSAEMLMAFLGYPDGLIKTADIALRSSAGRSR